MASTNQSPFYQKAEARFLAAQTSEEKLDALEEMIRECPKHKSSEKMLANLKTRYKKLKGQLSKSKKLRSGRKVGIKKEDMQAVIIGLSKSGKSSLLSLLTNANTKISSENDLSPLTKTPEVGMINYSSGVQSQLIEIPSLGSDYYDKSTVNTADVILILIVEIGQIDKIKNEIEKSRGKQLIVFNKIDLLNNQEKRKITATLQSKQYDFVLISTLTKEGIEDLKNKIFQNFGKIRVYTKEPYKKEKSDKPIIMKKDSTVKEIAEKILKGFSEKVKETKIWGPSSKFPGQIVGLKHKLKDLDIVQFKTQ